MWTIKSFDLIRWSRAVSVIWPHPAHSTKCSTFSCAVNGCVWVQKDVFLSLTLLMWMQCFHWFPQFSVENLKRLNQALFPPSASTMHSLCEEGFTDAVKFLKREGWMSWASHPSWTNRASEAWSVIYQEWINIIFSVFIHISTDSSLLEK